MWMCDITGADTRVVVRQQEALHPVLHVLQHPAVSQFITRRLDRKPVQTLRRVILDHLQHRRETKRDNKMSEGETE